MNPRTIAARSAPLFPVGAMERETLHSGSTADFQDLFDLGMQQIVCLNSCMIEIYRSAFLFAPVPGNLYDTAVQAFEYCVELQQNWFTLLVSCAASSMSSCPSIEVQPTPDELAYSMDIAIGERITAPGSVVANSMVASSLAIRPSRKPNARERNADGYRARAGG